MKTVHVSRGEAAMILNVDRRTIARLILTGELTESPWDLVGGSRVTMDSIREHIARELTRPGQGTPKYGTPFELYHALAHPTDCAHIDRLGPARGILIGLTVALTVFTVFGLTIWITR